MVLFASCTDQGYKEDELNIPNEDALEEAITKFGFSLMKKSNDNSNNVLISPLSIHMALSMAMAGADGNTLKDMANVLEVSDMTNGTVNASYQSLITRYALDDQLQLSNALFKDPNKISLKSEYTNIVDSYYEIFQKNLDFNATQSVDEINNWVNDQTKGKIKKVLDNIEQDEVMFLINALYFTGDWALGFPIENTGKGLFIENPGSQVSTDMMYSDEYRKFAITDSYSAVDIDIKESNYAMSFVMPKSQSASEWISKESNTDLIAWYKKMISEDLVENRVMITLPKFSMSNKLNLNEALKTLGMTSAFEGANFTQMGSSPLGPLYISRVLHDAFIKVDEKGVEGAAVTTVGIGANSAPPQIIYDRPFIFILRHKDGNVPIFIGLLNKID